MAPLDPQVYKGGRGTRIRSQAPRRGFFSDVAEFEWSGTFPFPALNSADLMVYLGIDGSISTDIAEDSSHLYQMEALPTLDIGTLGTTTAWDMDGQSFPPAIITDSNYRLGIDDIHHQDDLTDLISTGAGTQTIPSAMDGTVSFIMGGLMQVDTQPEADVNSFLISQFNNSTSRGWYIGMWNDFSGARKLRWVIKQAGFIQCIAALPIVYTEPFAWIANLDVAAGLLKVFTSVPESYAEIAWVDTGHFDPGFTPMLHGDKIIPTIGSHTGKRAQFFSFEYSTAIDAGLTEENMTQFLKYCDGFLTV